MNSRLEKIRFDCILEVCNDALLEYHKTVEGSLPGVQVCGIAVVGSFLTDDFIPYQSDLDIYLVTDQEYEHKDVFWKVINDEKYQNTLQKLVSANCRSVDCNGVISKSNVEDVLRSPCKVHI
jgi:predicted nucleotidyltransferase